MSSEILKLVDTTVFNYNKKIASIYKIDAKELNNLWSNSDFTVDGADSSDNNETISFEKLDKKLKGEIKDMCKNKGIKITGLNKEQLIHAYIEKMNNSENEVPISEVKSKNFTTKPEAVHIRKNSHGNLEHLETHLVFDEDTKKVIGIQLDDGSVKKISKTEIDICNKYNFDYTLPINLNSDTEEVYYKNQEVEDNDEHEDDEFLDEDIDLEDDILEDEEDEDIDEEEFEEEF